MKLTLLLLSIVFTSPSSHADMTDINVGGESNHANEINTDVEKQGDDVIYYAMK